MKKVFLGVGHGGSDPGAVKYLVEKDVNLQMALACAELLEANGVVVKLSRTKDENDTLSEEIKEANAFKPDLAVDIHNNAGGGDGFEVYHSISGIVGKELAKNLEAEIIKIGQNSRGCKTRANEKGTDYYGFIREINYPAVIVEGLFVDNANDIQIADTIEEQKEFGRAYARGILKTLGIEESKEETKTESKAETTSAELYRVRKSWEDVSSQIGAYKVLANAKAQADKNPGYKVFDSAGKVVYPVSTTTKPTTTTSATTTKKSIEEIAREVIAGKWGNGSARKSALTKAGYNYDEVQSKVDEIVSGKTTSNLKPIEEVAREVIRGEWGNGAERKKRLESAGYKYIEVQVAVNKLLSK